MRSSGRLAILLSVALLAGGCSGVQSALDPAGGEAARIGTLAWALVVFCTAVFLIVVAISYLALFGSERLRSVLAGERTIIIGGMIFPALSLIVLLALSIGVMGMRGNPEHENALRISVVGERWWWRVTYLTPDGRRVESANELRLPAGTPVSVELTSADVIHSFWVPNLAGKLDMIPGRTNTLTLEVDEPGISRGQCAEYCGGPHAFMSFFVIALPEREFDEWLAREASPAAPANGPQAELGRDVFMSTGCGGCHAIRGTSAKGRIGPDLTHVGSRHSLAAATLPNSPEAFGRWIEQGQHIKPENLMPPYRIFDERELDVLSTYLAQLK